jgi:dihydroorotate dehydrogenase electron transfer subunit
MSLKFRILPVLENKKFGPYRKVTLMDKEMHKWVGCGNFLMIGVMANDPYLLRPFSPFQVNITNFSILFKVRGKGTEVLSKVKKGDKLKVLGPLGRSFCPPERGVFLVGGIGIVPVYYQSTWMKGGTLFYGAKSKKDLILIRDFKKREFKVRTITEEKGGLVTDLVEKYKDELIGKEIFICGPNKMIKSIKEILNNEQLEKSYAYIEERMGCGLGGCKSCAVKTSDGYKFACTEGPVFPLKEVKFD